MRATALLAALLPLASAHFSLNYPSDRGDNGETQSDAPCGGLNTPSSTRTSWPIAGGQLSFEAGHDEANTAVYLALGNNPKKEDFTITVVDTFNQIGLGTFCWNTLELPRNLSITDGQNATLQVVQQGHDGGGLYNVFIPPPPPGLHCTDRTDARSAPTLPSPRLALERRLARTALASPLRLLLPARRPILPPPPLSVLVLAELTPSNSPVAPWSLVSSDLLPGFSRRW